MKMIPLTQGKFALVDDEDFAYLSQFKWFAHKSLKTWYAEKKIARKTISMHRLIMNRPENMQVDHSDRNGLNNQRNNLRVCNKKQNGANRDKQKNNTSGYKGVSWSTDDKKWRSAIKVNKITIYLGMYDNILDAAKAYNIAAKKYHGEFAYAKQD